jgi:hypothetical protein
MGQYLGNIKSKKPKREMKNFTFYYLLDVDGISEHKSMVVPAHSKAQAEAYFKMRYGRFINCVED